MNAFPTFPVLLLLLLTARSASAQCVPFPDLCPSSTTLVSKTRCIYRARTQDARIVRTRGFVCIPVACTGPCYEGRPTARAACNPRCALRRCRSRLGRAYGWRCAPPRVVIGATVPPVRATLPVLPPATLPRATSGTLPVLPPAQTGVQVLPGRPIGVGGAVPTLQGGGCFSGCLTSFNDVEQVCRLANCKIIFCGGDNGAIAYACVSSTTPGQAVLRGNTVVQMPATDPPASTAADQVTFAVETDPTTTEGTAAPVTTATRADTVTVPDVATPQTLPTVQTDAPSTQAPATDALTAATDPIAATDPVTTALQTGQFILPGAAVGSGSAGAANNGGGVTTGNVYYASSSDAQLFINGVPRGAVADDFAQTEEVAAILSAGDVVALEVANAAGGSFGAQAAIDFNGWDATGAASTTGEWRAISAAQYKGVANAWKFPSYDACGWAVASPPGGGQPTDGVATDFPTEANAAYVWAESAGANDGIFLRRVIGVACPTTGTNIVFAGDDDASLFINGEFRSSINDEALFREVYTPIADDDVVAFEVVNTASPYGFQAGIFTDAWSSTGADGEWRAIAATDYFGAPDAWKHKAYDACGWFPLNTGDPGSATGTLAPSFPADPSAQITWAEGASDVETIFVRRVVGETCPSTGDLLAFGGDDEASFFINGEFVSRTPEFRTARDVYRTFTDGEVLAFEVNNNQGRFGFIAGLRQGTDWSSTGSSADATAKEWRAIRSADYTNADPDAWKQPGFDACGWQPVLTGDPGNAPGATAGNFPYTDSNAGFVWADGAIGDDDIYVRHVVGGANCPDVADLATVYFAADDVATFFLNGVQIAEQRALAIARVIDLPIVDDDVLAFEATDNVGKFGFVGAVLKDGVWSSTGTVNTGEEWRAIRSSDYRGVADAWKQKDYDACGWFPAVTGNPGTVSAATGINFPYGASGGSFVWAQGGVSTETIYVRRQFGAMCPTAGQADTIAFGADDEASLYINDVFVSRTPRFDIARVLFKDLSAGDVLAFEAVDNRGAHAFVAGVEFGGAWSSTNEVDRLSTKEWRVIPASIYGDAPDAWRSASYTGACDWQPLSTGNPGRAGTRTAGGFPFTTSGGEKVWADGFGSGETLYIRHVVGGANCPTVADLATVAFGADDGAKMYIDGELVAETTSFRTARLLDLELPAGTRIAFEVQDGGGRYGFKAGILQGTTWSTTGSDVNFRAIKSTDFSGTTADEWKQASFDGCVWQSMTTGNPGNAAGVAAGNIPNAANAGFVWAANAGRSDTIYVWFEIGRTC